MAKDGVAQGRLLLAVLCPGALNDIANFHIRRAGDLAALAVNAVLQRLVVQRAILQTQAFAVRPRLFRARIARIDPTYRAGGGTDRALNAAFKTGIVHGRPPARAWICLAACSAVTAQTPPPQPS